MLMPAVPPGLVGRALLVLASPWAPLCSTAKPPNRPCPRFWKPSADVMPRGADSPAPSRLHLATQEAVNRAVLQGVPAPPGTAPFKHPTRGFGVPLSMYLPRRLWSEPSRRTSAKRTAQTGRWTRGRLTRQAPGAGSAAGQQHLRVLSLSPAALEAPPCRPFGTAAVLSAPPSPHPTTQPPPIIRPSSPLHPPPPRPPIRPSTPRSPTHPPLNRRSSQSTSSTRGCSR